MARALGMVAAAFGWLGWLTLSPAFGFPTLATAAMVNRVLVPREDPGFWLGWTLLLVGLVGAALVYLVAADRGRLRPGVVSGAVYGALCWLLVGAVIMPLLGLADPTPAPPAPAPPDPMRGSFMMLHLGVAAPIAALVAWLIFGAVVGSTSGSRSSDPSLGRPVPSWSGRPTEPAAVRSVLVTTAVGMVAIFAAGWFVGRLVIPWPGSPASAAEPDSGPVEALPEGAVFVSIIELPQAAGATLGPHAHVPGFAWSLDGVETINFHDGSTLRVGPGEAGFMGADAVHSHFNADDRLPAGALAVAIAALAGLACVVALRPEQPGGRFVLVLLVLLTATGALGTWNPWSNDWLFISVRPEAARGGAMPLPTASRVYESPDLSPLPPGPYLETLEEITVASGGDSVEIGSAGAVVLLVLDGRIEVQPDGGSSTTIGSHEATLVQPGASVVVSNPGDRPARLLKFVVEPTS